MDDFEKNEKERLMYSLLSCFEQLPAEKKYRVIDYAFKLAETEKQKKKKVVKIKDYVSRKYNKQ